MKQEDRAYQSGKPPKLSDIRDLLGAMRIDEQVGIMIEIGEEYPELSRQCASFLHDISRLSKAKSTTDAPRNGVSSSTAISRCERLYELSKKKQEEGKKLRKQAMEAIENTKPKPLPKKKQKRMRKKKSPASLAADRTLQTPGVNKENQKPSAIDPPSKSIKSEECSSPTIKNASTSPISDEKESNTSARENTNASTTSVVEAFKVTIVATRERIEVVLQEVRSFGRASEVVDNGVGCTTATRSIVAKEEEEEGEEEEDIDTSTYIDTSTMAVCEDFRPSFHSSFEKRDDVETGCESNHERRDDSETENNSDTETRDIEHAHSTGEHRYSKLYELSKDNHRVGMERRSQIELEHMVRCPPPLPPPSTKINIVTKTTNVSKKETLQSSGPRWLQLYELSKPKQREGMTRRKFIDDLSKMIKPRWPSSESMQSLSKMSVLTWLTSFSSSGDPSIKL